MTNLTYSSVPSGIDLGNVTVGVPSTQSFIVKYLIVGSGQTSPITNEVFYIQDNGTLARDFVLLSSDGVNFYNKISVASLPLDNYIKLWVRVSPTAPFYALRDYSIFITGTVNPNFTLPVKFRITGSRLCTTNDVRDRLGPVGRMKATIAIAGDEFDNLNSWTQVSGTWTAASNRVSVAGVGASQEGVLMFSSPFVDDYNEAVNLTITTGQLGLVFGYVNPSNYYAVMFSAANDLAYLI